MAHLHCNPALPMGEYALEIVESAYEPNADSTGMILKCKAQIIGGDHDQRPYYINYNLENENKTAEEMGQRDFAGLRRATGVLSPQTTDELLYKPFCVLIGIRETTGASVIRQYLFGDEAKRDAKQSSIAVKT